MARRTPPKKHWWLKFAPKVQWGRVAECWNWTAVKLPAGYGMFRHAGRMRLAHRVIWEMFFGPVPDGLVLDHYRCDNKSCVNPWHVRPVTSKENSTREGSKSICAYYKARTHCKNGHPYTGANFYVERLASQKQGPRRICRLCYRERYRERQREALRLEHG